MKNYFRFGDNFICFDHIAAVKAQLYSDNRSRIDQLLVYLSGGHDVPVPVTEQQRFLKEFQEFRRDANSSMG